MLKVNKMNVVMLSVMGPIIGACDASVLLLEPLCRVRKINKVFRKADIE